MNSLETKAMKIAQDKLQKSLVSIMDIQELAGCTVGSTSEEKKRIKSIVSQCENVMSNELHDVNNWMLALIGNKTI